MLEAEEPLNSWDFLHLLLWPCTDLCRSKLWTSLWDDDSSVLSQSQGRRKRLFFFLVSDSPGMEKLVTVTLLSLGPTVSNLSSQKD